MLEKDLKNIILMGENVTTELKTANQSLPKSVFETVCSFLNTIGGYIILGVTDKKEIIGISDDLVEKLKKDYTTMCNNEQILEPTIISELREINIDGKTILYTHIEESNEIHKHKGKVFIRNYEGDFDISNNISLIASVHNRKRKIFDEDEIYPYVSMEDLRSDLIDKARKYANSNIKRKHIWMDMNDLELLKSAGLYKKDVKTGKEGITLAGIMIFGTDEIIRNVNPYCRTDALYRVDDLDRYDDRDFIETNLLDTYDRLIDFIEKYTMDRFALDENARRVSPISVIAREIVLNTLMHRDITDGHTSRVIIYKDKIVCENPNSFSTMGLLTIKNYTPFAKNPTIAKFFREIGYADELGSGFIKITKNSYLYSGKPPIFEDKEMFRVTIPLLRDEKLDEVDLINLANDSMKNNEDIKEITERQKEIIELMKKDNTITQEQIAQLLNITRQTVTVEIKYLKDMKFIKREGSNKNGTWKIL